MECPLLKTSTIRKLSDIQWFKDKLQFLYPATYFPPFPKSTMFEGSDIKKADKKIKSLNIFFKSLLQSELIRSAEITRDFITLSQKEFDKKRVAHYDKLPAPSHMKNFITMEGILDTTIDSKIDDETSKIKQDINNKVYLYSNLKASIASLTSAFEYTSQKLNEVAVAFRKLSEGYHNTINSEYIDQAFCKLSNFTLDWSNGYLKQIRFFKEEIDDFFKYISKELETFLPLYDEYYNTKVNYVEITEILEKNRNNPGKIEDYKKDFYNAKSCFGFILNRVYDEYYRINGYHSKMIHERLEIMDSSKKTLLEDYNSLMRILSFA